MTRPILPLASGLAAAISLTAGLGVANGQTSYQSAVLADNPISYWSLDETTGTTAADQQGLNPGAFVELGSNLQLGQPGATIGGSSILCNGGFVTIPDDDSLDLTETFTIEMWIRPDVTTTPGYILDKDFDEYCVLIGFQSGKVNALMGTNYYGPSAMPITAGNWYHLVYTKNVNFVGDNWRGYLNGVEFFSSYNNFTLPTNTGNLNLGTSRGFADYFGLLDEVAIYDYALSSAQVANHHASATAPVDTDGDGLSDDDEVNVYGTDPNDADSDDDGLNDGDEVAHLPLPTDPLNPDSDGDTLLDGDEVANGTDPMVFDDITPPTADAGADQIVQAGDGVVLDGSASFDDTSGTNDLVFLWNLTSVPTGSGASLSGAGTQNPTFTADLPGVYSVDLVVTDEAGLVSVPDSVTVSSLNVAPTADAGDAVTVVINETAQLDGLGSSDPDGDMISYSWMLTGAPTGSMATLVGATTANPTLSPDLEGEYSVELVVNDGFVDSIAAEVVVSAITAGDFAKDKVRETMDFVRSLPHSAFDRRGHKRALLGSLRHVLRDLKRGKTFHAALKLEWWVLPRVDGVSLRGAVDPKGRWWTWWRTQRADWIVDEGAQVQVYDSLRAAADALSR